MREAMLVLVMSVAAVAGDEERRAEDRNLRGDAKSSRYEEALKGWKEKRGGEADDAARRERLDRILREETTRDEIPPVPRERAVEKRDPGNSKETKRTPPPQVDMGGSASAASGLASLMYGILILLAAAVLAFAIYGIVMAIQRARRKPLKDDDIDVVAGEEERGGAAPPILRDPEEWLAEARRLAAAGRWIEALRCLLFASLERLHRMRFIDYQRARTNRECVRAFTGPEARRVPFGALVDAFDVAVYGQRPFGAADYAQAEAAARELGKGDAHEGVA